MTKRTRALGRWIVDLWRHLEFRLRRRLRARKRAKNDPNVYPLW